MQFLICEVPLYPLSSELACVRESGPESGPGFQPEHITTKRCFLRFARERTDPAPSNFSCKKNHVTEMCSGSEAGLYLRRGLLYHSTLGLRVIMKKRRFALAFLLAFDGFEVDGSVPRVVSTRVCHGTNLHLSHQLNNTPRVIGNLRRRGDF